MLKNHNTNKYNDKPKDIHETKPTIRQNTKYKPNGNLSFGVFIYLNSSIL